MKHETLSLADFIARCGLPEIYHGLESPVATDLQGWNSKHAVFASLIDELKPTSIIEVGTWKGASAAHMAQLCKAAGLRSDLLCIDTWLGDGDMYVDPKLRRDLLPMGGKLPMLEQFLSNMKNLGLDDCVFAMPATANDAAEVLAGFGVQADLIYIDAAHSEESVARDLRNYWPMVRPGGALLGDDYVENNWPGVVKAANQFASQLGYPIEDRIGKFIIRKPLS